MSTRKIFHSEKQDTISVDPLDDWNGEEDIEEYLLKWFCPNKDEYSQEKIDKWLDSEDCALKQHLITSEGLLRLGGGLREYKTKTHHVKLVGTGSKRKGNLNLPGNAHGGYFQMTPL